VSHIDIKLDGQHNSKYYPLSMKGLDPKDIQGMKKLEVWHDLAVHHQEHYLQPQHQLDESQGQSNFSFFANAHFQKRPAAAKLGGQPYVLQKLIKDAELLEAAQAKASAPPPPPPKRKASGEPSESGSGSEDDSGSSDAAGGKETAGPAQEPRAAPSIGLGSLEVVAKARAKAKAKQVVRPRSRSPSVGKPASSSVVKAASSSLVKGPKGGGSKKEREMAQLLEQLQESDREMYNVAQEHIAHAKGTGVACLLTLNVKHFLTNSRQGVVLHNAGALDSSDSTV
ncbi:unnamed protein product, partial [Symbiodinium necroappetens]